MNRIKGIINKAMGSFYGSFIKGFVVVFSGQTAGSLINLISMLIFLKVIGNHGYGVFTMVVTYITLVYTIFSFKGFQSLIQYLNLVKTKDKNRAKSYIKSVFLMDIISGTLSIIVCFLGIENICSLMNWDISLVPLLKIFTLSILFNFSGTTTGILMSYQKYDYVVKSQLYSSVTKLLLYVLALVFQCNLIYFVVVEVITTILMNVISFGYSVKIMKREDLLFDFFKTKIIRDKEFWMFNINSSLASTIDLPVGQIATFVVNKYLGFDATSAYAIFERLGQIVSKIVSPITQVVFPEISQKISCGDINGGFKLVKIIRRLMLIFYIIVGLTVLLTYKFWMGIFFENPSDYIYLFLFYLFYQIYIGMASPIHSIFIALGFIKFTPFICLIVNAIYLVILLVVVKPFGLAGVIFSYLLQAMAIVAIKRIILHFNKNSYMLKNKEE